MNFSKLVCVLMIISQISGFSSSFSRAKAVISLVSCSKACVVLLAWTILMLLYLLGRNLHDEIQGFGRGDFICATCGTCMRDIGIHGNKGAGLVNCHRGNGGCGCFKLLCFFF